jgi:hypothetical protein
VVRTRRKMENGARTRRLLIPLQLNLWTLTIFEYIGRGFVFNLLTRLSMRVAAMAVLVVFTILDLLTM